MAIERTALGTATDKSAGLTLTQASITLAGGGSVLLVGLAYDAGNGHPTVTWGVHELDLVAQQAGNGVVAALHGFYRPAGSKTKTVTATWTTSAPTAKAMFLTEVTGAVGTLDVSASASDAASSSPSSGTGVTTAVADEIFIGVVATGGPASDTAGSWSGSWTNGQRAGTAGAPPLSNVTVNEGYKIVSATESAQAAKTGMTARDHSTICATFGEVLDYRQGITPTDLNAMRRIFDDATPEISEKRHAFHWNTLLGRWELYEIGISANGTLVAFIGPTDGGWVEV